MTKRLAQAYIDTHGAAIRADMRAKRERAIAEAAPEPVGKHDPARVLPDPHEDGITKREKRRREHMLGVARERAYVHWRQARKRALAHIGYPAHETTTVDRVRLPDGEDRDGNPKTKALVVEASSLPAAPGITPRVVPTSFYGGRDSVTGEKQEDGRGAIVCIETDAGCYRMHVGYHNGSPKDGWEDADA